MSALVKRATNRSLKCSWTSRGAAAIEFGAGFAPINRGCAFAGIAMTALAAIASAALRIFCDIFGLLGDWMRRSRLIQSHLSVAKGASIAVVIPVAATAVPAAILVTALVLPAVLLSQLTVLTRMLPIQLTMKLTMLPWRHAFFVGLLMDIIESIVLVVVPLIELFMIVLVRRLVLISAVIGMRHCRGGDAQCQQRPSYNKA
jgi:hypothetical protein